MDKHVDRERDFWNHEVPTVDEVIKEFESGPDLATKAMLSAVCVDSRAEILDLACGGGVTSLWLAKEGMCPTGIDLSPRSIEVGRAAAQKLGLSVQFEVINLISEDLPRNEYAGIVGRYALHHLDVPATAEKLARVLRPGGTAAFVETMAINPVLKAARSHLVGRLGIQRLGTVDEHPLTRADVRTIQQLIGPTRLETPDYRFMRVFDRQVLRYRHPLVSQALTFADITLAKLPLIGDWSYHQVIIADRRFP